MTPLILCFSGRIGSGKTSVSRRVAETLGAAWTGFGDFVRAVAASRSLDVSSREVLQALGAQLLQDHGAAWFCQQVIARSGWDGRQPLVIDGVRHVDVLNEIGQQLSTHRMVLFYLDLSDQDIPARGIDASTRRVIEEHSTEHDVLGALRERANLVVSTAQPLDEVVSTVVNFARSLSPGAVRFPSR